MLNLDNYNQRKTEIMNALASAVRNNDETAMQQAMTDWQNYLSESIIAEANGILGATDSNILASRGVRQLTSKEKKFYESLIASARQEVTPGSVITGIGEALPETTIESVFDDLKQNHPLLNAINFTNTSAITKMVMNKQGSQTATWDELNTPITKQLVGEIEIVTMTLCKLTAYMFVTFDMLDLGPAWIDKYVRETLAEALSVGLETAIVDGNGVNQPIGMTRNFTGSFNSSTGYARNSATAIKALDTDTYGTLLSTLAKAPNGNIRTISEVVLIVNPVDYFTKVMPATTVLAPDGTYRNNIFPFPTKLIQSVGAPEGHAIIGLAPRYFMGMGTAKGGKLEYDDSYKFIEDLRTYKIKLYGMGKPLDKNAFIYLDISNLKNVLPTFKVVTETTAGSSGS
ncbi:MAG: phage major capsid protein [Oscillospiraceae bacterium]|nr:phage major capsid protein [Oscillospiraceae bacterium]